MSLPGGVAAKLGGRYEARWTLHCLLEVLADRARWILVEPPGEVGEGIEFVFARSDREEQYQVRRQLTGVGHWTLAALRRAGVLEHFKRLLDRGGNPRFVSGHDAHELHELGDRARRSNDFSEFRARWLPEVWESAFETLASMWGWSEIETYAALQRCDVITVGEDELDEWNRSVAERYVDAEPAVALVSLAQVAIDNMQQPLDADRLWRELERCYGLRPRRWVDATVREQVRQIFRDYCAPLEAVRLRHLIPRREADQAFERLTKGEKLGVLLAGPAGSGKSDVILQIAQRAEESGWPVLALRVDRLRDAPRPEALGKQLDLQASPAAVLGALAPDGPSLLIVDQLDAVSLASGRLRHLWEPVSALLRQAQAQLGMRVLVACRQFDLDSDHRLRGLATEDGPLQAVPVSGLTAAQIDQAVREMGANPTRLSLAQRKLLELPLHLALLEPLVEAGESLTFTTSKELFDAFWARKRQTVEERKENVSWNGTLKLLSDEMSARRTLSVPNSVLELSDRDRDANVLASEHVLIRDGDSFAFFHESFFDYAYARYFIAEGKRVMDLLADDDQDLFRRAQVRQVLLLERDANRHAYLHDLRELLLDKGVRFHIRQVTLALLRTIQDPTREELALLRPILEGDPANPIWHLVWRAIAAPAWFSVADDDGLIAAWLSSDDPVLINAAVRLLPDVATSHPGRVATHIRQADDGGADWLQRIGYVLRYAEVDGDRALFDLLLDYVARAPLDQGDHELWLTVHDLPSKHPDWAVEVLAALLARAQSQALQQGRVHALEQDGPLQHDHSATEFIRTLRETRPLGLVTVAMPWVLEVARADVDARGPREEDPERLVRDRVWGTRFTNVEHDFSDVLLAVLVESLREVAAHHPQQFSTWAETLAASDLDVAQYLLYKSITGNPAPFAEWVAKRLLERPSRWCSGYYDDRWWATRELLDATSPYLTPVTFARLERAILEWTPRTEKQAIARRMRGKSQLTLLSGLDRSRLSTRARRRLAELRRKLGTDLEPPRGLIVGPVESPIGEGAATKMSDERWLEAIAKHRGSWADSRSDDLVGGAEELSSTMSRLAQADPARWARLGLRFPDNTLSTYFEQLLIGLSQPTREAERATREEVFALVRHVAALPARPAQRELAWLVSRYAQDEIPADLLRIVSDIACDAEDPDRELWNVDAGGGEPYYGGDPWHHGMNTARGAAAETIGQLIYADESRVDGLMPAICALVADSSTAVRTCAGTALAALMRWRRDEAVALLVNLLDAEPAVVASRDVGRAMAAATATHWHVLHPVVERMLSSEAEAVQRVSARVACLAALQEQDAESLLDRCVKNHKPTVRCGAAQVLTANLSKAYLAERCASALIMLFDDEVEQVRAEAVKVFWHMDGGDLAGQADIVHAVLASAAFPQARGYLIRALETSTANVTELTLALARRMLEQDRETLGDIREATAGEAKDLSDLLIRALGDSEGDSAARREALDALDTLTAAGAWGVVDAMEAVDR